MRFTMRVAVVLAFLATACGGSSPDESASDLGVGQCRPLARCGEMNRRYCADITSDARNCGGCGIRCGTGEACVSGECRVPCGDGLVSCGADAARSYCADISCDRSNCGSCGTACASGEVCRSNACQPLCEPGEDVCGPANAEYCADLQSDGKNCGACGNACPTYHACVQGACTFICDAPLSRCDPATGPECVDQSTDPNNCGGCGNVCGDGHSCVAGRCTLNCAAGLVECNGACVDLRSDLNCGACGNDCTQVAGYACEARPDQSWACVVQCPSPQIRCGEPGSEFCTDSSTDGGNCGGCGKVCGAGTTCTGGNCACDAPTVNCTGPNGGTICVDKTTDEQNCGGCGITCNASLGEICDEARCVSPANAPSYVMTKSMVDALRAPQQSLAFDGTYYWAVGSRYTYGLVSYTTAGVSKKYSTFYDFSSVASADGRGRIYARSTADAWMYQMNSATGFVDVAYLMNGVLDNDSSVAVTANPVTFVALSDGVVTTWNALGELPVSFQLASWGTIAGERNVPQRSRMALVGDTILTYSNGTLSFWSRTTGQRLRTTQLVGAGTTVASHYSFSFADGLVWVLDDVGGTWRGYSVGL
jgi:hypothetical protein